jgi:hypothetical protein
VAEKTNHEDAKTPRNAKHLNGEAEGGKFGLFFYRIPGLVGVECNEDGDLVGSP